MKKHLLICSFAAVLAPAVLLMGTSGAALAQTAPAGQMAAPAIDGFNVEKVARLEPGAALHFYLYGSPGASVTLNIDGASRSVQMQETKPGQYNGSYVIGQGDRLLTTSRVSAEMRLGSQVATSELRDGLARPDAPPPAPPRQLASKDAKVVSAAPGASPPPPPRTTERPRVARYCTSCAIVERVEVIQDPVSNPRPLASEVQSRQRYRVTVRFNTSEASEAFEFDNNPGYRKGDPVRVNNGVLTLDKP